MLRWIRILTQAQTSTLVGAWTMSSSSSLAGGLGGFLVCSAILRGERRITQGGDEEHIGDVDRQDSWRWDGYLGFCVYTSRTSSFCCASHLMYGIHSGSGSASLFMFILKQHPHPSHWSTRVTAPSSRLLAPRPDMGSSHAGGMHLGVPLTQGSIFDVWASRAAEPGPVTCRLWRQEKDRIACLEDGCDTSISLETASLKVPGLFLHIELSRNVERAKCQSEGLGFVLVLGHHDADGTQKGSCPENWILAPTRTCGRTPSPWAKHFHP
jgi:hypothetical protein